MRITHRTGLAIAKLPRGRPPRLATMRRATARLLVDVPDYIQATYPIDDFELTDGLSILSVHWRSKLVAGELREMDLCAAVMPIAGLASAIIEALLRATPIDRRGALFDELAGESGGILAGSPKAILLRSGIV